MMGNESKAVNMPCIRNDIPAVMLPIQVLTAMVKMAESPKATVMGTPKINKIANVKNRIRVII